MMSTLLRDSYGREGAGFTTLMMAALFSLGLLASHGYAPAAWAGGTVKNCSTFYGPGGKGVGTLEEALVGGGVITFGCSGTIVAPEIIISTNTRIDATGRTVILSGNNTPSTDGHCYTCNRVFHVTEGAQLDLVNVTVTNGRTINLMGHYGFGGGIYNEGTLTLTRSTVSNNAAYEAGGGIYNSGTVRLIDSAVTGNRADITGPLDCTGCMGGSQAWDGGGIFNAAGTVELIRTSVTGNIALNVGGGILNQNPPRCSFPPQPEDPPCSWPDSLIVRDSTIASNTAGVGGGIYSDYGDGTLTNSTIANNTASFAGGGIRVMQSGDELPLLRLTNVTVSGNQAAYCGGLCGGSHLSAAIIANNNSSDCSGWMIDGGYNLASDATCKLVNSSSLNETDPKLLPLGNYGGPTPTVALATDSPAIDHNPAGSPTACGQATDQRGVARPQGGACDIGAFEFSTAESSTIAANFNNTAIPYPRYVWFNSVIKPNNTTDGASYHFSGPKVTFTANSIPYEVQLPDGEVIFSASVTKATATTTFEDGQWLTRVPAGYGGEVFLTGLPFPVPASGLPGGLNPVTWSGAFFSNKPKTSVSWKWAAAVYTRFAADPDQVAVKPIKDPTAEHPNSHLAGSPENFTAYVTGGARGNGGANFTGFYSAAKSVSLTP